VAGAVVAPGGPGLDLAAAAYRVAVRVLAVAVDWQPVAEGVRAPAEVCGKPARGPARAGGFPVAVGAAEACLVVLGVGRAAESGMGPACLADLVSLAGEVA